jgi:hypothetical protein
MLFRLAPFGNIRLIGECLSALIRRHVVVTVSCLKGKKSVYLRRPAEVIAGFVNSVVEGSSYIICSIIRSASTGSKKILLPKSTMLRPSPIINTVVEGHRLTVSTIVAVIRLPSHSTAKSSRYSCAPLPTISQTPHQPDRLLQSCELTIAICISQRPQTTR